MVFCCAHLIWKESALSASATIGTVYEVLVLISCTHMTILTWVEFGHTCDRNFKWLAISSLFTLRNFQIYLIQQCDWLEVGGLVIHGHLRLLILCLIWLVHPEVSLQREKFGKKKPKKQYRQNISLILRTLMKHAALILSLSLTPHRPLLWWPILESFCCYNWHWNLYCLSLSPYGVYASGC